jgi:acyl dehydratase
MTLAVASNMTRESSQKRFRRSQGVVESVVKPFNIIVTAAVSSEDRCRNAVAANFKLTSSLHRSWGSCEDCEDLMNDSAAIDRYLEDFAVGQTYRSRDLRVTAEDIKRFATAFDPQPFHLDGERARSTIFEGLAASGWHTAALTMKLLVESDFKPVGGLIGVGFEGRWPKPVRPGDELHVEAEVVDVRLSKSNPTRGVMTVRAATLNQHGESVQLSTFKLIVPCRS